MNTKEGKCPNCGNKNLEWGDSMNADNNIGYEFHCPKCHKNFVEWFKLVYVETKEKGK